MKTAVVTAALLAAITSPALAAPALASPVEIWVEVPPPDARTVCDLLLALKRTGLPGAAAPYDTGCEGSMRICESLRMLRELQGSRNLPDPVDGAVATAIAAIEASEACILGCVFEDPYGGVRLDPETLQAQVVTNCVKVGSVPVSGGPAAF